MWGIWGENVDFSQQIPHIFSVQQLTTSTSVGFVANKAKAALKRLVVLDH